MIKENRHLEGKQARMILFKLARTNRLVLEYNADSLEMTLAENAAAKHVAIHVCITSHFLL